MGGADGTGRPDRVEDWRIYSRDGIRLGPVSAVVTIVEFGDFQCPFCARAHPFLKRMRHRHPDDLALVYRHYPLHDFSLQAAAASECAARVGAFERFSDLLFAQTDSIGSKSMPTFAIEAGMKDAIRFVACMDDSTTRARIRQDTMAALRLGVSGTPTFLINDVRVVGFGGRDAVKRYVEAALRASEDVGSRP